MPINHRPGRPIMPALLAAALLAACQQGPDFRPAGTANGSWRPIYHEFDGITHVYVPAGCFVIGRNDGPFEETPARRVCLTEFWIGQTEVTNAQYAACVEAGECTPPMDRAQFDSPAYASHPVVFVTWEQADAYARWRGGQLPTEAQWEYAVRGTASVMYPWGDDSPTCDRVQVADCPGGVSAVGPDQRERGQTWVGALDMVGNVWEWTANWYDERHYSSFGDGGVDPVGPAEGAMRVLRGGAWGDEIERARPTYRGRHSPSFFSNTRGLRVVIVAGRNP